MVNFASMTIPLLTLLKKNVKWGPEQEKAFNEVKTAFLSVVMLKHPDSLKPYLVQTGSSGYDVGGCLF